MQLGQRGMLPHLVMHFSGREERWPRQKILGCFVCRLFLGFLFWIFLKQKKTQPDTKARKKEEVIKLVRNIAFIL